MKTERELLALLHAAVEQYGTQSALARAIGITPQHLGDVLKGNRGVSDTIAQFFGCRKVVRFEKK